MNNKGFIGLGLIPLIVAFAGGVTLVGFLSGWLIQALTVATLGFVGYILISKGVEVYQVVPDGNPAVYTILIFSGLFCFLLMIHMINPGLFQDLTHFSIAGDVPATAEPLMMAPLQVTPLSESSLGGVPWWGLVVISIMILAGLYFMIAGEQGRQKITSLSLRRSM